jgi:hypothetical protein
MEVAWCEQTTALAETERASMARQARKEQLRSGKAIRAEATWHGFDTQRKNGGGGRPALMASQQVERAAELQDPEVRTDLD